VVELGLGAEQLARLGLKEQPERARQGFVVHDAVGLVHELLRVMLARQRDVHVEAAAGGDGDDVARDGLDQRAQVPGLFARRRPRHALRVEVDAQRVLGPDGERLAPLAGFEQRGRHVQLAGVGVDVAQLEHVRHRLGFVLTPPPGCFAAVLVHDQVVRQAGHVLR
jgi:hypothetical protein